MPTSFTLAHPAYDAVIVGARPAGASTALLLARAGLRVLVVDHGSPGTDTVSTHALMRGAVLQLDRWGVLGAIEAARTPPIERTVFHYGAEVVPVDIKPRGGARGLYAPRRTVLDPVLVEAAREAGAEVRHGVTLSELIWTRDGRVRGVVLTDRVGQVARVDAAIVVGADGRRSKVAELVGAPTERLSRHATAMLYAYFEGLAPNAYHWHWAPSFGAGAIPTGDGLACVFVGGRPEEVQRALGAGSEAAFRALLARAAPELGTELDGRAPAGRIVRFAGALGHFRRPAGEGWALVGDASHFKDPITSHGITDALRDAELLARAIARGSAPALREYAETRDALSTRMFEITDEVASMRWDLETLPALHRELSREMTREVAFMEQEFGAGELCRAPGWLGEAETGTPSGAGLGETNAGAFTGPGPYVARSVRSMSAA